MKVEFYSLVPTIGMARENARRAFHLGVRN